MRRHRALTWVVAFSAAGLWTVRPPDAAAQRPLPDRVVRNPYETVEWGRVRMFVANFHAHTILSDGRAEPDELIRLYADAGYHILAITDHDNHHTVREGERHVEPTAETTWPWTRWIEQRPARVWSRNGSETSAFYPDLGAEGMLAIRGNELTTDPHIVSLFNPCGWLERGGQADDERLSCVERQGGLSWWAHPVDYAPEGRWEGRVFPASWEEAVRYFGDPVARYDSHLGVEMQLGRRREAEMELIHRILDAYARDGSVLLFGGDDNHSRRVGGGATITLVLAAELTEEAVRHALRSGHTLVGSRADSYPTLRAVRVDADQGRIELEIDSVEGIRWIANGEEVGTGAAINIGEMRDVVLRFEIDHAGRTFYSQALVIR